MHATWYSFGFLSEPRAKIREAMGIQFNLSMEQAHRHCTVTRWAEEAVWHSRSQRLLAGPGSASSVTWDVPFLCRLCTLQCTPRLSRGCCFSGVFLSSMQIKIFQIPFRASFREAILSKTAFYISLQACKRGWRLSVAPGQCELHEIFLGWHPLLLTQ